MKEDIQENAFGEPVKISHLRCGEDGKWVFQSNEEHSTGVAELAAKFAGEFGLGDLARIMGLLHDLGKQSSAFQQYIRRESGYMPQLPSVAEHSHAYAGAVMARKNYQAISTLIANAIAGHHRGLYNAYELETLLKRDLPKEINEESIDLPPMPGCGLPELKYYDIHSLIRMLFSCLVDADYLDTERFMNPDQSARRGGHKDMKVLLNDLDRHLGRLEKSAKATPVNKIRRDVQNDCRQMGGGAMGHYELSVPTGGGKTLASLLWALRHAVSHGLDRIIITIPYTSIIEQTCMTLKEIFGEENVLEHHSQVDHEGIDDYYLKQRVKLATENWDAPIVVTTNVRLFEAMFSNRPKDCRRLHNLVNSVVILDEVQTLPLGYYSPLLTVFDSYARLFKVSFLYTTASQPVISGDIYGSNKMVKAVSLPVSPMKIIDKPVEYWQPLKRVNLEFCEDGMTYDMLAEEIGRMERVLCIVNTRRHAYEIRKRIKDEEEACTFLLSRLMYPKHIKEQIAKIKRYLAEPGRRVRVIATQLVEAGVDLDFPLVMRQEAGLDSIIQAAGRCNREGGMKNHGVTKVFRIDEPNSVPPGLISKANQARLNMGTGWDWFSEDAMKEYFRQLCRKVDSFDRNETLKQLNPRVLNFETAAEEFKLIQEDVTPIFIPGEDRMDILEKFRVGIADKVLFREVAQYSVSVPRYHVEKMENSGLLIEVGPLTVLADSRGYSDRYGLDLENEWIDEPIII